MFRFIKNIGPFSILLTTFFAFMSVGNAIDITGPLPKLTAEKTLLKGPSSAFFEEYDEGVKGKCDLLLKHLSKSLQSSNSDVKYSAQLIYAEMYDRAVCVEYSASKSFEYFKQAADGGGPAIYAFVGWKYFFGHGVKQSNAKANEAFKLLLTRNTVFGNSLTYDHYENLLRDRKIPILLKKGVDWLIQKTSSDEKLIHFAQELLDGTAIYFDGSPFKKDQKAAYNILFRLSAKNSTASLVLANAILQGKIPSSPMSEAHFFLEMSANCGNTDAMLEMAQYHQTGQYNFLKINSIAYSWLYTAKFLGLDVENQMKTLKEKIENQGNDSARQEFPRNYRPQSCRAVK
ncbi:MAG: sel1 repeat family protein [Methylocystaceae bacterium]|nr:sel1 repeat family protein [Methylocystaceae bacterium]